jgi:N-carbamoyl-L-amino-acid hydrolase
MDAAGVNVGIVTGSYTAHGMHVQITGETQHVGPTPMERRRNALVGAGYLIADVNDIGWKYYEDGDGKTTVTRIECHPNLFGIIPDSVRLTVDFRHPDGERVNDMFEEIREAMARAAEKARVSMEIVEKWTFGMVPFDADCIALLRDTARDMGLDYMEIPSQAGHDAYAIARVAPTCMIFTPCREGYTHNVKEEIELDKTVPGVNLLLNAVLRRANR